MKKARNLAFFVRFVFEKNPFIRVVQNEKISATVFRSGDFNYAKDRREYKFSIIHFQVSIKLLLVFDFGPVLTAPAAACELAGVMGGVATADSRAA